MMVPKCFLGYDRGLFPGLNCPGTWSWYSKEVATLHPVVVSVVVLTMGVAAAEATTRTIATTRNAVWCSAVAETTVPVQARLMAVTEIPVTSSGQTKGPARKTETVMLHGHKPSKGKKHSPARMPSFLTFLLLGLFSVLEQCVLITWEENMEIEVNVATFH